MELGLNLFHQILVMAVIMAAGFLSYRKKWLSDEGVRGLSNLVMYICTPCVMIHAFDYDYSPERMRGLLLAFALSLLTHVIGIAAGTAVYKRAAGVERFATVFSNSAFIGIPLVKAALGEEAVFYLTAYLVLFNLLVWTVGIYQISGDRKAMSLRQAMKTPVVWSLGVGLVLFVTPLSLPSFLNEGVQILAEANTFGGMVLIGAYLAQCRLAEIFTRPENYGVSAMRLVVVPILTALIFCLVPNTYLEVKETILIAASAPVAGLTSIFADRYGGDYKKGALIISQSTLLSLLSLPLIVMAGQAMWGV
jgi:predicted permease